MTARMQITLLTLLILASPGAGAIDFAEAKKIEDAKGECVMRSKTTPAILGCQASANQQLDDLLKEAYAELKGLFEKHALANPKVGNEGLRRFEKQQALWPKFREIECRMQSGGQIGSSLGGEEIAFSSCLFRETQQRLMVLFAMMYK